MPKKKAFSNYTAASIERDSANWIKLVTSIATHGKMAGEDFKSVSGNIGQARVSTSKSGMLILDGLTLNSSNAHISIVPNDSGHWTYLHFTVVGGSGGCCYYELTRDEDDDPDLTVSPTTVSLIREEGKKKKMGNTAHSLTPPENLTNDLGIIIRALVGSRFEEGDAF